MCFSVIDLPWKLQTAVIAETRICPTTVWGAFIVIIPMAPAARIDVALARIGNVKVEVGGTGVGHEDGGEKESEGAELHV
jgi:hypothetical protein